MEEKKKKIKNMTIDSISDMATIIRNAITIKNSLVTLPYTKNNEIIAKILAKEGFIHCVTTTNKTNQDSWFDFQENQKFSENNFDKTSHDVRKLTKSASKLPLQKDEKINSIDNNNLSIDTTTESQNTSWNTNQDNSVQNYSYSASTFPGSSSSKSKSTEINQSGARTANSRLKPEGKPQKVIILALKYVGREKKPIIHAIKRISKPSLRWYAQSPIPQSLGGLGIFIVSTSFGIITDKEARDKKLGGEILLEIW